MLQRAGGSGYGDRRRGGLSEGNQGCTASVQQAQPCGAHCQQQQHLQASPLLPTEAAKRNRQPSSWLRTEFRWCRERRISFAPAIVSSHVNSSKPEQVMRPVACVALSLAAAHSHPMKSAAHSSVARSFQILSVTVPASIAGDDASRFSIIDFNAAFPRICGVASGSGGMDSTRLAKAITIRASHENHS